MEIDNRDPSQEPIYLADSFLALYSLLGLTFYATANELKRRIDELKDQYKEDDEMLDTVEQAEAVLLNLKARKVYFNELELRYYLSQQSTLADVRHRNGRRIFPFSLFKVNKVTEKKKTVTILLRFDFINQIVDEIHGDFNIESIHFRNIEGAIASVGEDALLMTCHAGQKKLHSVEYRTFYHTQRSLIVETFNLIKKVVTFQTRKYLRSNFANPNVVKGEEKKSKKSKEDQTGDHVHVEEKGHKRTSSVESTIPLGVTKMQINLITSDKMFPPKGLLQASALRLAGLLEIDQPGYILVGISEVIFVAQKDGLLVPLNLFSLETSKFSMVRQDATLILQTFDDKYWFRFADESKAKHVYDVIDHIVRYELNYELQPATIYPHNKRNDFVIRIKKMKLKDIEAKIEETKRYIEELGNYRVKLDEEILKDEALAEDPDDEHRYDQNSPGLPKDMDFALKNQDTIRENRPMEPAKGLVRIDTNIGAPKDLEIIDGTEVVIPDDNILADGNIDFAEKLIDSELRKSGKGT